MRIKIQQISIDFFSRQKNYFTEEIKLNDLITEKYKKIYQYLNYVERLLIWASVITSCVSSSAFNSLFCVPVDITSSAVGLNICAIIAGINCINQLSKKRIIK